MLNSVGEFLILFKKFLQLLFLWKIIHFMCFRFIGIKLRIVFLSSKHSYSLWLLPSLGSQDYLCSSLARASSPLPSPRAVSQPGGLSYCGLCKEQVLVLSILSIDHLPPPLLLISVFVIIIFIFLFSLSFLALQLLNLNAYLILRFSYRHIRV